MPRLKKLHVGGRSRRVTERYRRALTDFPYVRPELLKRAVVVCHRHADVDAYCAAYGVAYILRRLRKGVSVSVVAPDGLSIPAKRVASKYPVRLVEKPNCERADIAVVVDTGNLALLGEFVEPLKAAGCVKVFLDHHPLSSSVKGAADYGVLDESATSTSEVIYDILTALKLPVSKAVAQVLLTGIIFDSQHLKLADYRTVKIVAELCGRGASIGGSIRILGVLRKSSERIARLKGAQRLSLHRLGDWIIGSTEVGSYHASVARALVDLGVDLAVAAGENSGESRCCLRANQRFHKAVGIHLGGDVAEKVAASLGGVGGGHPTAASFTVNADVEKVIQSVLKVVEDATGLKIRKLS